MRTLRGRVALLLVALHLGLAALAWLTVSARPVLLFAFEAALVGSALVSFRLLGAFERPREVAEIGRELLAERDFATRFREIGSGDVDSLVRLYNRLAEELREERVRLEERNLLLDKLVAASPAGVVLLDFDGAIALANRAAARLLGTGAAELAGRRLGEIDHPLAVAAARLGPAASALVALPGGRRVRLVAGEFSDRGHARRFLLAEELTEELAASERAAHERLVRQVAHEVNNSAGALGSLLESLVDMVERLPPGERADAAEALAAARVRLAHLATFVAGIGEVVRLPAPRRARLDLGAVVAALAAVERARAASAGVELLVETAPDVPPIDGDRVQLEQALSNVLANAREAAGAGGRVAVRLARETSGGARLTVADDGPGLPAGGAERLFEPFVTTKADGHGLGLPLVAEILRRHDAEFALADGAAGGAEFRVRFPAAAP